MLLGDNLWWLSPKWFGTCFWAVRPIAAVARTQELCLNGPRYLELDCADAVEYTRYEVGSPCSHRGRKCIFVLVVQPFVGTLTIRRAA